MKMPRRRPLHTCAASCIGIAHKACKKLQDVDGPVGSTAKRAIAIATSFFPLLHTLLYHHLAILSIIDDQILTLESKIEMIFPQSTYLFDKIDALVCSTEALPQKLDSVFTKISSLMQHFPLLLRLVSFSTCMGSREKEKEMKMDVRCNTEKKQDEEETTTNNAKDLPKGVVHLSMKRFHSWKSRMKALEEPLYAGDSPMYSSYQSANSSPVSDSSPDASSPAGKADAMNCSYKEMLKKGTKEDD